MSCASFWTTTDKVFIRLSDEHPSQRGVLVSFSCRRSCTHRFSPYLFSIVSSQQAILTKTGFIHLDCCAVFNRFSKQLRTEENNIRSTSFNLAVSVGSATLT